MIVPAKGMVAVFDGYLLHGALPSLRGVTRCISLTFHRLLQPFVDLSPPCHCLSERVERAINVQMLLDMNVYM